MTSSHSLETSSQTSPVLDVSDTPTAHAPGRTSDSISNSPLKKPFAAHKKKLKFADMRSVKRAADPGQNPVPSPWFVQRAADADKSITHRASLPSLQPARIAVDKAKSSKIRVK